MRKCRIELRLRIKNLKATRMFGKFSLVFNVHQTNLSASQRLKNVNYFDDSIYTTIETSNKLGSNQKLKIIFR